MPALLPRANKFRSGPANLASFISNANTSKYRSGSSNRHGALKVMKSAIIKRSIILNGHKTSISLEDAFWKGLKDIAIAQSVHVSALVQAIDSARGDSNLSSAIRLYVLSQYRQANRVNAAATLEELEP